MRSLFSRTLLFLLPALLLLSACGQVNDTTDAIYRVSSNESLSQPETGTPSPNADQAPEAEASGDSFPAHLAVALSFEGVTEATGNNDGPEVKRFLAAVDLDQGYPWCAAFVSFTLDSARAELPEVRSALAYDFITERSLPARKVLRGTEYVPPGAVVIWRKGNTTFGHAGFAVTWDGPSGATIEGNTSPGAAGSQADGEGVYRRTRSIQPGSYFRITHFTPVRYSYA